MCKLDGLASLVTPSTTRENPSVCNQQFYIEGEEDQEGEEEEDEEEEEEKPELTKTHTQI